MGGWGHKIVVTLYVEGPQSDEMAVIAAEDFAEMVKRVQPSVLQVSVLSQTLRRKPRRASYPAWELDQEKESTR